MAAPGCLPALDRARLARLLAIAAGSEFDGEALAALRAADKMRRAAAASWDEIVAPPPPARPPPPPPPAAPPQPHDLFWHPESAIRFLRQHHRLVPPADVPFLRRVARKCTVRALAPAEVRLLAVISHKVFLSVQVDPPAA